MWFSLRTSFKGEEGIRDFACLHLHETCLAQESSRPRGLEGRPELLLWRARETVRERELDLGVLEKKSHKILDLKFQKKNTTLQQEVGGKGGLGWDGTQVSTSCHKIIHETHDTVIPHEITFLFSRPADQAHITRADSKYKVKP